MKDELTEMVKSLQASVRWTLGICAGAIVLLLVGYGTMQARNIDMDERLQRINDNYAPLVIVQDIYENNDKMLQIIQMLPQTSKDDPRYMEAIRDRESFQREALSRAATVKRGGYASQSGIGGAQ